MHLVFYCDGSIHSIYLLSAMGLNCVFVFVVTFRLRDHGGHISYPHIIQISS